MLRNRVTQLTEDTMEVMEMVVAAFTEQTQELRLLYVLMGGTVPEHRN